MANCNNETDGSNEELGQQIDALCQKLEAIIEDSNADMTVALSTVCLLLSKQLIRTMGSRSLAIDSFRNTGIPIIENTIAEVIEFDSPSIH